MEPNQAVVDEILESAEADSPESRISKLEKEVETLKGSIKKLLLDLRETLNNIENPFQNLQKLAEEGVLSPAKQQQPPVQQVQIIPPQPPEQTQEEKEPEEKENGEGLDSDKELERVSDEKKKEEGDVVKTLYSAKEEPKRFEPLEERAEKNRVVQRYDMVTLFNLMEWVKEILQSYSLESLKLMLEIFESAGYISEDTRDFVTKIAELVSLNDGYEDIILELYRLYKLMNPSDTSIDSKLLNLIMEKRL